MQKQFYFLSPVEVVQVTRDNFEEVAEWCGGKVLQAEHKHIPGRVDPYVMVPTPKGSPGTPQAFSGMFVTKRLVKTPKDELRTTFAVFRRDYFEKNYFNTPKDAVDETWEIEAKLRKAQEPITGAHLTQTILEAIPKPTAPKSVKPMTEAALQEAIGEIQAVGASLEDVERNIDLIKELAGMTGAEQVEAIAEGQATINEVRQANQVRQVIGLAAMREV